MTISAIIDRLEQGIDDAVQGGRIVGCTVMLAQGGQIVLARSAGMADREAGRAMTPDTWLRYASISKPFATVAALRLMAAGRLAPEDPVTRYLPDFTPTLPDGTRPQITVNQLMSHMAGLDYSFAQPPGGSYHMAKVSDGIGDSGITLADNLCRIASVPLDRAPGSAWRYSIATDVLGAVIEAVCDKPLPDAMAELVTDPLGIQAAFRVDVDRLAANYADGDPPVRMQGLTRVPIPQTEDLHYSFLPQRNIDPAAYPSAGGGMSGTVPAALTLLKTLRAGPFIPDELRRLAQTNRINQPHPMRGPAWGHAWAGAVLLQPGFGLAPGCLSWGGIYGHYWLIDPSRQLTLLSMTNTTPQGVNGPFSTRMSAALID